MHSLARVSAVLLLSSGLIASSLGTAFAAPAAAAAPTARVTQTASIQTQLAGVARDASGRALSGILFAFDTSLPEPAATDVDTLRRSASDELVVGNDASALPGGFASKKLNSSSSYRLYFVTDAGTFTPSGWVGGDRSFATAGQFSPAANTDLTLPRLSESEMAPATQRLHGDPAANEPLSVNLDDWAVEPLSVEYIWRVDGAVTGPNRPKSYAYTDADGKQLDATVIGTYRGAEPNSVVQISRTTAKITGQSLKDWRPEPSRSTTAVVGKTVTVLFKNPAPAGGALTYQWMLDDKKIPGATQRSYVVSDADWHKFLSVVVSMRAPGYYNHEETLYIGDVFRPSLPIPRPVVTGPRLVGKTLTAKVDTSKVKGAKIRYQWRRGHEAIKGATGLSYKHPHPTNTWLLNFQVIATKPGFEDTYVNSLPMDIRHGMSASKPTITGTAQVGKKLTAKPGKWTKGAVLRYQWKRNGKDIPKATKSTYTVAAKDKGTRISVSVKGSKGRTYEVRTLTSSKTKVVAAGKITAGRVYVAGTPKVGKVLKAVSSKWKPSGVRLSYQWKANGKRIAGATKSTYKVASKYRHHRVSVSVTGSKAGYKSASVSLRRGLLIR